MTDNIDDCVGVKVHARDPRGPEIGAQNPTDVPWEAIGIDRECFDAIEAVTRGRYGIEAFCIGFILWRLWNWRGNSKMNELKNAQWCLEHLIPKMDKIYGKHHKGAIGDRGDACKNPGYLRQRVSDI